MPTACRYRALQWFLDHELLGPDGVFDRRPPSAKMRRLMADEGQVVRLPTGQFGYQKWLLTALGREVLQSKPPPRRRRCISDEERNSGQGRQGRHRAARRTVMRE
jgi:hypothetical protein